MQTIKKKTGIKALMRYIRDYGLNKWVLRDRLNPEIESLFLMSCGRLFHMAGAQTEKALEAMTVLVRGISSRPWLLERNARLGLLSGSATVWRS